MLLLALWGYYFLAGLVGFFGYLALDMILKFDPETLNSPSNMLGLLLALMGMALVLPPLGLLMQKLFKKS